jgi:hypothetical protein
MRINQYRGAAVAAVVVAALALPGVAHSATTLPDATVVITAVPGDYTITTTTGYWSVVGLQPSFDNDYDLRLSDGSGASGASALGTGYTDFVAIDSNFERRQRGSYTVSVTRWSGTGGYAVQFRDGHSLASLPRPAWDGVSGPSDPDITLATLPDQAVVTIADIYLDAGTAFWASSTSWAGHLFLLESTSDATTWIQNRGIARLGGDPVIVDGCTLYTARASGWHALVVIGDRFPGSIGADASYALHAYDPNRPITCPVKNFPSPTPPPPAPTTAAAR